MNLQQAFDFIVQAFIVQVLCGAFADTCLTGG